ncbi:hypothetical protein HPB50_027200 [Hyalomma asiaticum]|uniref:Uncharacterized protein n=1 Tax=Hyalomma asiaticum TaxID=266040 RepID=A0ACB7TRY7_HYAAI|nr:hypothetical protein HPB50_027200 [Hyalomma asiaticum]
MVGPLPKNMLAGIHDGRRTDRARNQHRAHGTNTKAAHVHVARYANPRYAYAMNVSAKRTLLDKQLATICSGSIRTKDPTEAEEAAIALAAVAGKGDGDDRPEDGSHSGRSSPS